MKLSEHVGSTSRLTDTAIYKKITHILHKIFAAITGIKNNTHVSSTTLSRPEGEKTGLLNPFPSIVSVSRYDADKAENTATTASPADNKRFSTPETATPDPTSTAATENSSVNNAAVNKPLKSILKNREAILNKADISITDTHGNKHKLGTVEQISYNRLQQYIATNMAEIGGVSVNPQAAVQFTITGTDKKQQVVTLAMGFQPGKNGKAQTERQLDTGEQMKKLIAKLPDLQRRQDSGTRIKEGEIRISFNDETRVTGITEEKTVKIANTPVIALKEHLEQNMKKIGGVSAHATTSLVKLTIEGTIKNNEGQDETVNQTIYFMPQYQDNNRFRYAFNNRSDNKGKALATDANLQFNKGIQQQLEKLKQDLAQWQTQPYPQAAQVMANNAPDSIENTQKRSITIDESENTRHIWELQDDEKTGEKKVKKRYSEN